MAEFNIFETIYPVVEVLDAEMERIMKCHLELIKDYEALHKEYHRLKKELDKLKNQLQEANEKLDVYGVSH